MVNKKAEPPRSEWKELAENIFSVLDHLDIPLDDPDKWFHLSLALVRKHYPNGIGKAGRPSQANLLSLLPKGKPGRPREWDEKRYAAMLRSVEMRKITLSGGKNVRITDKAALKDIISSRAKKRGESVTKVLAEDLPYYQKRLSEARRKIPKTPEK